MRLATLEDGSRDGALSVIGDDGMHHLPAGEGLSLQRALDDWDATRPRLEALAARLARGEGERLALDRVRAPLPRAYEWIDGSAYINHIVLVRKARGAEPPVMLREDPLVYQGGSGVLLGPRAPLRLVHPDFGLDYEAELVVVLGDTPMGTTAEGAGAYVRLVGLCNDVTYRGLVPGELAKGFGFFQSKPATAFAPFVVTPDELGGAYAGGRIHLAVRSYVNGALMGDPDAGPEMHFSFFDLVEHVTRTRALTAGTLLGSGTISNADEARGVSCLAERRVREVLEHGEAKTPFLGLGDEVRIEVLDPRGRSVFGAIEQKVVA